MDAIRSMLQGAVGAAGAGSGTGATGGGNGGDGGPQELNPNAAVLKDSLFGNLLGGNGHGDEQEGQPNVSYEIDARAEPSAEMQSLSEPYSYQVSYSRGGNDPESLGLSPLRSGSVAPPNAGAAELLSPIPTVNKTKHDISTIASPSLDDESETTSALMDTSEERSEGDLTYRIPLETPSWAKDGNLRQVPTPSTFRSFRAEGLHVDMEAIFHGSGGGLDDVDDDDEGDVLGREEEEEADVEEVDVEEADAKRRAEEEAEEAAAPIPAAEADALADNDDEFPSLDEEEIQEEAGEEEGVGAAGTNEEVDSPPAEANDTTAANASSALDTFNPEPTPLALQSASQRPYDEGRRCRPNMMIYGFRLELSKPLLDKGKRGINACNFHLQLKPMGSYIKHARRKGDCTSLPEELLIHMGYHSSLLEAVKYASRGDVRNQEIPGGANGDRVLPANPQDIQIIDDVWLAFFAFCCADATTNCLMVNNSDLVLAPFGGESNLGVFLRKILCDKFGKISSFDDALRIVSETAGIPFDLARCTRRRIEGIDAGNSRHKLECLLVLSSEEPDRMFVLQCVDKHAASSHYVGLVAGTILDNCASTGGKFDAKEYADEFLSGVRKAAEILVRPTKKKKKKKKAPVESEDDANKKARIR